MKFKTLHPWDVRPGEAIQIQKKLKGSLELQDRPQGVRFVAGADMAISRSRLEGITAVIIFSFPELIPVERAWATDRLKFPYIPGLLSFRESPVLLQAFEKIRTEPDVIFIDGHGIAHPRGLGIASHLGLLLDKPTVGCAKSRLVGTYEEPAGARGQWSPLLHEGQTVGAALRTREGTTPIFVSPGHKIDLTGAIESTFACTDGYRVPKPTRLADELVGRLKRGEE